MTIDTFSMTLEHAFMIAPKVKHFVFSRQSEIPFNYLPGQFITIHIEQGEKILRRSYSIANAPTQNNHIEFAAGYVQGGPATALLFNLQPGDSLKTNGPFGRLTLKDECPKRYIFIATSTGITPYRAMIPELKRRLDLHPQLEVVILQGVRKQEDILYQNDFLELMTEHPRVTFRAHLSQEKRDDLQAHEHKSQVQGSFPDLALNPSEDTIYLCGNPSMIDDAFDYFKNKGFAMQQIIREKYISR